MFVRSLFPACLLIAGLMAPALAATGDSSAAKPDKRAESHSGVSSKPYGSWSLRCEAAHTEGAEPLCEISETIVTQSSKPIAKISVGRRHPGDPMNLVVILPTNVSFPSTVHIRTDKADKWGLELEWQRCIPGACVAATEMSPAAIAHWKALSSDGKIIFRDADGDEVGLPMSLRGFDEAFDAFNK
jgi:invasion protein IalB